MTRLLLLAATIITLQSMAPAVFGQPITVPNFSFEQDVQASDPSATPGATGWTSAGSAFTDNPPGPSGFTGATGFGTPIGGDGPQSGYLGGIAFFQSALSLATVSGGATYSLTVAIGDRIGVEPGTVRIGFLLNDAFVPGGDTSFAAANYSPEGAFSDFTFQYTAQPADAGKTLKVYLGETSGGDVNYDNARLSVVPEPSSALLLLSGVALCWRARSLRRAPRNA